MKLDKADKKRYITAKEKVQKLKIFYLHLILYIIVVALISYNFYIMVEGPYTNNITALNISVLVLWTLVICIHAWIVFKGKPLFKKDWEHKKIEKILKEDEKVENNFWE